MSKKILVTGGTGFVGSFVIEELLAAHVTVRAMIRNPKQLGWLEKLPIEFAVGNLDDETSMIAAVKSCDVVIHCAGLTKAIQSSELHRVNANATARLVEFARDARVKRFIYCSSQAAAGPSSSRPRVESDPAEPISDYGRSKLAGEIAVKAGAGDMEWIIVRPPAVFGPRDDQFVPLFRASYRYGIYPIWGSGKQEYSLVYVKDLARILATLARTDHGMNDIYFVARTAPCNWAEFSSLIAKAAGKKSRPVRLPAAALKLAAPVIELFARLQGKPALLSREKIREILAPAWVCSSAKLNTVFDLRCDYDLQLAINETIHDYRIRQKI